MFWNVRAMPSAATLSGRSSLMLRPFQRTSPTCGMYTWLIELKIDVFPAPFGPMMANSSPVSTVNETLLIASTPPKRSVISSTWSNGVASVIRRSAVREGSAPEHVSVKAQVGRRAARHRPTRRVSESRRDE